MAAGEPAFALASCDLVEMPARAIHVAPHIPAIRHAAILWGVLVVCRICRNKIILSLL